MSQTFGTLFVVATPIGNLADMVPRAVDVLQDVDLIAAEDTRHTARLLAHFDIRTQCTAYHDHSDDRRTRAIVARLERGESVALVSDAGTPLVSDPGYQLVRAVRELGAQVVPIPGACAFVAALSAAGLPSDRFAFEGFLPAKPGARRRQLEALQASPYTLVFYESPHRILACLEDMQSVLGPEREVAIARELTKTFETIRTDRLESLLEWMREDANQQRGEFVVMVRAASEPDDDGAEAHRVMAALMVELPLKQASRLTAQLTGARKNELYQWALGQKG